MKLITTADAVDGGASTVIGATLIAPNGTPGFPCAAEGPVGTLEITGLQITAEGQLNDNVYIGLADNGLVTPESGDAPPFQSIEIYNPRRGSLIIPSEELSYVFPASGNLYYAAAPSGGNGHMAVGETQVVTVNFDPTVIGLGGAGALRNALS